MTDESGLNAIWDAVPVKHSAIPEDVMDTAERISNGLSSHRDQDDRDNCALAIARAILAERERCAKVAEEHRLDGPRYDPALDCGTWPWAVAAAIRQEAV